MGLVSAFAAIGVLLGVLQSTNDSQRVFSLFVALVYGRLLDFQDYAGPSPSDSAFGF